MIRNFGIYVSITGGGPAMFDKRWRLSDHADRYHVAAVYRVKVGYNAQWASTNNTILLMLDNTTYEVKDILDKADLPDGIEALWKDDNAIKQSRSGGGVGVPIKVVDGSQDSDGDVP